MLRPLAPLVAPPPAPLLLAAAAFLPAGFLVGVLVATGWRGEAAAAAADDDAAPPRERVERRVLVLMVGCTVLD